MRPACSAGSLHLGLGSGLGFKLQDVLHREADSPDSKPVGSKFTVFPQTGDSHVTEVPAILKLLDGKEGSGLDLMGSFVTGSSRKAGGVFDEAERGDVGGDVFHNSSFEPLWNSRTCFFRGKGKFRLFCRSWSGVAPCAGGGVP